MRTKPTPTALKILRGNPGKRPISRREPRPRLEPPLAPARFEHSAAALKHWHALAPTLTRLGLLTEVDGHAFAELCDYLADIDAARLELYASGPVVRTAEGTAVISPYYNVVLRASASAARLLAEFGLTPSARARIEVTVPHEDGDQLETYLTTPRRRA
jgi:P27 family predicted phage terminase small subunit